MHNNFDHKRFFDSKINKQIKTNLFWQKTLECVWLQFLFKLNRKVCQSRNHPLAGMWEIKSTTTTTTTTTKNQYFDRIWCILSGRNWTGDKIFLVSKTCLKFVQPAEIFFMRYQIRGFILLKQLNLLSRDSSQITKQM